MARLIPRLLRLAVHRLAGPPTDREAGRALARKAAELARQKAAAGRPQLIAHLASFGEFARGIDRLTEGEPNA